MYDTATLLTTLANSNLKVEIVGPKELKEMENHILAKIKDFQLIDMAPLIESLYKLNYEPTALIGELN